MTPWPWKVVTTQQALFWQLLLVAKQGLQANYAWDSIFESEVQRSPERKIPNISHSASIIGLA